LFPLSEWIPQAPRPGRHELDCLQQEIRGVLRDLAAGDPWVDTPSYRRLASQGKWKRKGLDHFEYGATWAFIPEPVAVEFQWWREGAAIDEVIIPRDLRSGVLMRLREAIMLRRRRFRVRKCPVCGSFFLRVKRQLYCEPPCAARADEALRTPGRRWRIKRRR
jgi:hypothetical protein